MSCHHCRCYVYIVVIICFRLTNGLTTEQPLSNTNSTTDGETSHTTPAPAAPTGDQNAFDAAGDGTTETFTEEAVNSTESTNLTEPGPSATEQAIEAPTPTTANPVVIPDVCLCDLTPELCDIGCCCDVVDCDVADLSTVFNGCPHKAVLGVCVERWLMFKANVDPSLVSVTDSLFCVRAEDKAPTHTPPPSPQSPTLGDSYHFSGPDTAVADGYSQAFYRVDDVIQTYYSGTSVWSVLRQSSPGAGTTACFDHNPAKFLRSGRASCTRAVTSGSCTTDPSLQAHSYFSGLSLIKLPTMETEQLADLLISVTPLSSWPAPSIVNDSCLNVVSKVELVVGFTGRGELANATLDVVLVDVKTDQLLSQTHSVNFQLATSSPIPAGPIPAVGLPLGSPVIGRFNETVEPITILGVSGGTKCSFDPRSRTTVLFPHNVMSGCIFSSLSVDCSELRSQLYQVLQGLVLPDQVAMNWGPDPDWTRVISQRCQFSPQESCETGCVLPLSLSIQVLWARLGWLHLPQNYILGTKYHFLCQKVKCPLSSSLMVSTDVRFADATRYPPPPRGSPQADWKFPFGFFSRGSSELDGHVVSGSAPRVVATPCWPLLGAVLTTAYFGTYFMVMI